MNLSSFFCMLLGAALVAGGVLANALADRIRGLKITREAQPRTNRTQPAPAPIQVVEAEQVPAVRPAPVKRATRPEVKTPATEGSEEVIAALVTAGYKKPVATEATWACGAGERASVEVWTAAALRRCALRGMS